MRIHRLETTDAFIAFDLEAPTAVGVTRLAPKVLLDGAELLARSATYAFAAFELQLAGASAGINAKPDGRDAAVAAYVAEVEPLATDHRFVTSPGVGVTEADLAPLRAHDPRPAELWQDGLEVDLVVRGALAAAEVVLGGLDGATAAIDGFAWGHEQLAAALVERGASVAEGSTADVHFAGGRAGSLDHEAAEAVSVRAVVPLTAVPVTAKALAVLGRAGAVVVPDFLSTAAPLLHGFDGAGGDPVERVRAIVTDLAPEGTGMWLAAAGRAETFLRTWQADLPFGRPLA